MPTSANTYCYLVMFIYCADFIDLISIVSNSALSVDECKFQKYKHNAALRIIFSSSFKNEL